MKLNTLAAHIVAAMATVCVIPSTFASHAQEYETSISVNSVQCGIAVHPLGGATTFEGKYTYTAQDEANGTSGSFVFTDAAERGIIVSSSSQTCSVPTFVVQTSRQGVPITLSLDALKTNQGGVWPAVAYYTDATAYPDTDPSGSTAIAAGVGYDYIVPGAAFADVENQTVLPTDTLRGSTTTLNNMSTYGDEYEYGTGPDSRSPGYCSAAVRLRSTTNRGLDLCGVNQVPRAWVRGTPARLTIRAPQAARSVVIGLGLALAKAPYSDTTKLIDPLTVYDTATGQGIPLTAASTVSVNVL